MVRGSEPGARGVRDQGGERVRSFRMACPPGGESRVAAMLSRQGFSPRVEPFSPLAWSVEEEPFPLGASMAARFGLIYIQDRSSMLAPLALAPRPGERVLDMCASPGGKTGFSAMMVGPEGLVVANEPSRDRLATLRSNLKRQNLFMAVTCSCPGQELPFADGSFAAILLDPPCSGWGVSDKHPRVKRIWTGDKVEPLISLQRNLLAEACRLLAPGGRIIYSTCTTNVRENEDQVHWAREELGLAPQPLARAGGMAFLPSARQDLDGVLRVDESGHGDQGHFVARLGKPGRVRRDPVEGEPGLPRGGVAVPFEDLEGTGLDFSPLAHGRVVRFNDAVFYLPDKALDLARESSLRWQGISLGRMRGNRLRVDQDLRVLCPPFDPGTGIDLARLEGVRGYGEEDGPAMFKDLAEGRSVMLDPGACRGCKEVHLYYDGLALGRVSLKGRRLIGSGL